MLAKAALSDKAPAVTYRGHRRRWMAVPPEASDWAAIEMEGMTAAQPLDLLASHSQIVRRQRHHPSTQSAMGAVVELSGNGRALMVYSVHSEQRLSFKVHGHHWKPVDYEGITLIRRPEHDSEPASTPTPANWSKVGNRKRFARRTSKMPDSPTPPPHLGQTE
jgi:hypothetical protein